jgi:pimeloyl-ACP methyl ester carboxylesterase
MTDHTEVDMDAETWMASCHRLPTAKGELAWRSTGEGPTMLLLHGFPTWSYDWAGVAPTLARSFRVVTPDFLGYGASDKPRDGTTVPASADAITRLVAELGVPEVHLVIHDYGGIVGQELLDRLDRGVLGFDVASLQILNGSVFLGAYRPTATQRLLLHPLLGPVAARLLTPSMARRGLDRVRGTPLSDAEFAALWAGMSRDGGHRRAHIQLGYVHERDTHAPRWEAATRAYRGPVHLVWGLDDPVSGRGALDLATAALPDAHVTTLPGVGHFPQSEAPDAVAAALLWAAA